jgi:hypothetical protein
MDGPLVIAADVRFSGKIYPNRCLLSFSVLNTKHTESQITYITFSIFPPMITMARKTNECLRPWD